MDLRADLQAAIDMAHESMTEPERQALADMLDTLRFQAHTAGVLQVWTAQDMCMASGLLRDVRFDTRMQVRDAVQRLRSAVRDLT